MNGFVMPVSDRLAMSSREIASLTEKRHDNVRRTMDSLASKGLITVTQIEEPTPGGGKPVIIYQVGKRDSYVVVAQLSPEFTARLVDRWQELEDQQSLALPKTKAEALRQLADQIEENEILQIEKDEAIRTKAEIGSRREATAMAKASTETRRANKLEEKLGVSERWKSAKAIVWLKEVFDLPPKSPGYSQIGKKLTAISKEMGIDTKELEDSHYGCVKGYHISVIDELYKRLRSNPQLLIKYRLCGSGESE